MDENDKIVDVDFSKKKEEVRKPSHTCAACNHVAYGGLVVLKLGNLTVIICEKCYTLQIPASAYAEIKRQMNTRIIT